jgi:hypothetical protein
MRERRRIEKLKPSQETGSKTAFRTQSRIRTSVVTECYKKQLTEIQLFISFPLEH